MARRASSSAHPIWILVGLALVLGAVAGGYFLFNHAGDPYRTMAELPVADYLENSNSLRGNVYKIDVTISKRLDSWPTSAGRLFSVDTGKEVLPIRVPPQFNQINIERGQRYFFKIEVGEKGILTAQDIKKV